MRRIRQPLDRSGVIRRRVPTGADRAFAAAVAILGPYPWGRPVQLEIPNWVTDLPELVTEEAIAKQVKRIGGHYLYDLDRDAASPRIKTALEAFQEIAELCDRLAHCLAGLSEIERRFFTLAKAEDQDAKKWHEDIFTKLPSIFDLTENGHLPPGAGVQWLRNVANHSRFAISSLAENNVPGKRYTADPGGNRNLHRIHLASPSWMLVKMSWQLFEWAPHCQPSGTAQGPLHDFLGHFHEWVTGEIVVGTGKFESHLKAFAKPWRRKKRLLKDYIALKESLPEEIQSYLDTALSGYRPDLRDHFSEPVLVQGARLQREISAISRILEFGPSLGSKV